MPSGKIIRRLCIIDSHPFSLLRPYQDTLHVLLSSKADAVPTDADVARALGAQGTAALWQVHGNRVIVARAPIARSEKADGVLTDTPGLALAIRAADCQTFLVYAPEKHVVGLMHVGWRCLLAGTIPAFFMLLRKEWGVAGADTIVCAGPSLCKACSGFTDPARELPGIDPQFFDGHLVDLRGIAERQLTEAGVNRKRFERHPDCTRCRNDLHWSYRGTDRQAVSEGKSNVLACVLVAA